VAYAEQASQKLIRSRAGLTGDRTAPRDHALLALALATGLRAIELAALDVGDLSREWRAGQEEWWLVLPDSKTKGQSGGRTLPLAPELVQILHDYLEVTGRHWERPEDRGTPLFLSGAVSNQRAPQTRTARQHIDKTTEAQSMPPLRRLSPSQIRLIVDRVETQWQALYEGADRKHGRRSGDARRISPHALRHSTAIALLEGNRANGRPPASVEHVRGWLGHLDIRTTQGYLAHLDARRHRRPFTLSPVGKIDAASPGDGGDAGM
jgi:integrase